MSTRSSVKQPRPSPTGTLRPRFAAAPTAAAKGILFGLLALVAVCVLGAGLLGKTTAAGEFAPDPPLMSLAALGTVTFLVITLGWTMPGVRRLYVKPRPLALASDEVLELHIPSVGIRIYRWDEIGSLSGGRSGRGVLRSPTGEALVTIPSYLMSDGRHTLAQLVVEARSDRFVSRGSLLRAPKYFQSTPDI